MGNYWLKVIGGRGDPCPEEYALKYDFVDFPMGKRPSGIHVGDRMILYAAGGGTKHLFADAEVTSRIERATWPASEPRRSEWERDFPHRLKIEYAIRLPVSSGVELAEIDTDGKLRNRIKWGPPYLKLDPQVYKRAATKLVRQQGVAREPVYPAKLPVGREYQEGAVARVQGQMTAEELEAILRSLEFQEYLEKMIAYWGHWKQEKAIVDLLAKFLERKRPGRVILFENKHRDLVVDQTHLEFKYHFDCDMEKLEQELANYSDKPLGAMWKDVQAGNLHKTWTVMPSIYEDMCVRRPDIFVWIICARDLSKVPSDALKYICWSAQQRKWDATHQHADPANLKPADLLLGKVREERRCSIQSCEILTRGATLHVAADHHGPSSAALSFVTFPSIYHFRICDFSNTLKSTGGGASTASDGSHIPKQEIPPAVPKAIVASDQDRQPEVAPQQAPTAWSETFPKPEGTTEPFVGPQDKYAQVASYIKQHYPRWTVQLPSRATGGYLLVTDTTTGKSVSLGVRFSQDKLPKHCKKNPAVLGDKLMAVGWWSFGKRDLQNSRPDFWVFVLPSLSERTISFIIFPPRELFQRLQRIRGHIEDRIDLYLWPTRDGRCWETRDLPSEFDRAIDNGTYENPARDFSTFLNAWHLVAARLKQIVIRDEAKYDAAVITAVTVAAFESMEISNHTEQFIIEALRSAGALTLSLVAEVDGRVVGHIAFSPVAISDGTKNWYGLGPVSVLPMYQRMSIGKALIQEGLARLKDLDAKGCCLVGHPQYYRKFGFENVAGLACAGVPAEVFFALSFDGCFPRGNVTFHEGFKANGQQAQPGDAAAPRP